MSAHEPLRIGVLGAARIAARAIVAPAHLTGARLVAVAARDTARGKAFADEHGIPRVLDGYQALVADPEVEAVYDPLPNGLHGRWNLAAIAAGKHVLSEKPFAANATEAERVRDAARGSGLVVGEAFHYRYHPLIGRLLDLVADGAVGDVTHVESTMVMPEPAPGDPRWSLALAGGGLMDVGCYALHVQRVLGTHPGSGLGGEPRVVTARAVERAGAPGVDESLDVDLVFPSGVTGVVRSGMTAPQVRFALRVTGTLGEIELPAFVMPHLDDRILVRLHGGVHRVEHLGRRTSYTYQLEAFARSVRSGVPFATDADDAVVTMRLIDASYLAAGLAPRTPSATL